MNTRILALAALAVFGILSIGHAEETKTPSPNSLKPAVSDLPFIISYWWGPPMQETTLERYKEIAEAGFNVAMPASTAGKTPPAENEAHNRKFLDLCKQVGIKGVIADSAMPYGDGDKMAAPKPEEIPAIQKSLDSIIAKYSTHPALLGYFVTDEPAVPAFARTGLITQYLLKKDPKHLPYTNILPNYAGGDGGQWSKPKYEGTVAKYIEEVNPTLMSWDHYRQMMGGGDESFYWQNLEVMRKLCTKAGIPYIQIIVSLKHMGYRECSEADLRWQVYTSLAFGSRGIMYFTYWDVKGLAWADAPAIITMDGKRDKKYDYVKKINARIAKLGPTLTKLVCTGAYCNAPLPPDGVPLSADAPVKKIDGGRIVVGCFHDAGDKRYIFPVNRTVNKIITAKLTLDETAESVSEVSQETGELLPPTPLTDGSLELKLQPGDGQLFLINKKK